MATQTLTFDYHEAINSCRPGETELQMGEEVVLELKEKNPLWPSYIKATVALVVYTTYGRQYTFDYEGYDLNGGATIESCDVTEIRCYSCCDTNLERLNALITALPVTENDDGSFTYEIVNAFGNPIPNT